MAARKISCGRRSKRLRRLKWTRQETIDLIAAWKDMSHLFKTFGQRKIFYEEISKKLHHMGHNRSTEQCQTKMNRLKYIYRRFKVDPDNDKQLPFCESVKEMLDECCMSGDEVSDDCLEEENSGVIYPALYVQAELKLSPDRKEQDYNWDFCDHSSGVNNEELVCNTELPHSPTSITREEDTSCVTQKTKSRSEIWTYNETIALISEWKKVYKSCSLKKVIYEDLAKNLAKHGYVRTGEQCQRKMSHLKVKYKKQHKSNDDSCWPYYSALHEFLGKQVSRCTVFTRNKVNVEDTWTNSETESLISIWKVLNSELEKTVIRTPIYEKMSHHLTELGFERSAEECQQKVIQLKILYKQATSSNSDYFDESWPYYDAVHEIMSKSVDKTDLASKYTPFLLKKTLLLEYETEYNSENRTSVKECPSNKSEQPITDNIKNMFPKTHHDCPLLTVVNVNENGDALNIQRKNVMEPRRILPKSSFINVATTAQQEQNNKECDIITKLNAKATKEAVPCLESSVLLLVPPSSQSSVSGTSESSLVLMSLDSLKSQSTNLVSSDFQQTSNPWPTSLLLISTTDNSISSLQN